MAHVLAANISGLVWVRVTSRLGSQDKHQQMMASATSVPWGACELVLEGVGSSVDESRRFALPACRVVEDSTTRGGRFEIAISASDVFISLLTANPSTQKAWVSVLSPRHDSGMLQWCEVANMIASTFLVVEISA